MAAVCFHPFRPLHYSTEREMPPFQNDMEVRSACRQQKQTLARAAEGAEKFSPKRKKRRLTAEGEYGNMCLRLVEINRRSSGEELSFGRSVKHD